MRLKTTYEVQVEIDLTEQGVRDLLEIRRQYLAGIISTVPEAFITAFEKMEHTSVSDTEVLHSMLGEATASAINYMLPRSYPKAHAVGVVKRVSFYETAEKPGIPSGLTPVVIDRRGA